MWWSEHRERLDERDAQATRPRPRAPSLVPGPPLRQHRVQNHAVRLGMWLFLGTEVLLFAGLFLGYTVYRWLYHQAFKLALAAAEPDAGHASTRWCSSPAASRWPGPTTPSRTTRSSGACSCWRSPSLCALRLPGHQVLRVRPQVPRGAAARASTTPTPGIQTRPAPTSSTRSTSWPPACTPSTSSWA